MPTTPHIEQHFTATEMVRDVVIGMSDGLTVPFALAAGISGAISAAHIRKLNATHGYIEDCTTDEMTDELATLAADRDLLLQLVRALGVDPGSRAKVVDALIGTMRQLDVPGKLRRRAGWLLGRPALWARRPRRWSSAGWCRSTT